MTLTPNYKWKCPDCEDTLAAYSESGLENMKLLHVESHRRTAIRSDFASRLVLLQGRVKIEDGSRFGTWIDWDDRQWLKDLAINGDAFDDRTPSELAARYKPPMAQEGQ